MRKQLECTCENCGTSYMKDASEVKRNIKKGRKSFCSISCAISYRHQFDVSDKEQQNRDMFSKNHAGKHPKTLDEYSPFRETLRRAKRHAKENDRECIITLQDLKSLWEKQQGKCVYTNVTLALPTGTNKVCITNQASLDRIDSTKGYIPSNIQFISSCINFLKNKLTDLETKRFLKEISSFTSTFIEDETISSSHNEMSDALAGN